MGGHAHFFDLGDQEDGLALVHELVKRDWGSLSEDERDELVQEGYLALERLRTDYDRARCDRFRAYARTSGAAPV